MKINFLIMKTKWWRWTTLQYDNCKNNTNDEFTLNTHQTTVTYKYLYNTK